MKQLEQALHADVRVPVTLPRATGREEDFVFVALNGKGYTIRRGQTVLVPRPVYDILAESERQQQRQQAFIRQQQENAARSAAVTGLADL